MLLTCEQRETLIASEAGQAWMESISESCTLAYPAGSLQWDELEAFEILVETGDLEPKQTC